MTKENMRVIARLVSFATMFVALYGQNLRKGEGGNSNCNQGDGPNCIYYPWNRKDNRSSSSNITTLNNY